MQGADDVKVGNLGAEPKAEISWFGWALPLDVAAMSESLQECDMGLLLWAATNSGSREIECSRWFQGRTKFAQ
jgi:hypothetical protein